MKADYIEGFDAGVAIILQEIEAWLDLRPEQESVLAPLLEHLKDEDTVPEKKVEKS
jgi:hypothetical protein